MEWQTEAIDTDAHPLPHTAAELVKEVEKAELPPAKAATLRAILKHVRESVDNALKLLDDEPLALPADDAPAFSVAPRLSFAPPAESPVAPAAGLDERVVEGVFDGQAMVGGDGKSYSIPPNYASKSKLVEGDMLKLTIGARGNFIYKQIGPIERQRLIGTLASDQETGQYLVVAGGRSWKVLKASITYYKADAGDEAVILAPKNAPSKWAAVENIIRKQPSAAPIP
jgi:hypothetical protein